MAAPLPPQGNRGAGAVLPSALLEQRAAPPGGGREMDKERDVIVLDPPSGPGNQGGQAGPNTPGSGGGPGGGPGGGGAGAPGVGPPGGRRFQMFDDSLGGYNGGGGRR